MITALTGVASVQKVTTVADSTDSLDGTYFTVSSPANTFGVWFNTSGGSATIPTMTGATASIEVALATDATAAAVASAIVSAMEHLPDFATIVAAGAGSDEVTFTCAQGGTCSVAAAGTSGFTPASTTPGSGDYMELGENDEDVTFSPSPEKKKFLSGNTGTINVEYELSLRILNVNERMRDILSDYDGDNVTLVFADFQDTANIKAYVIENIVADFSDDPQGDTRALVLDASKTVSRSLNALTYNSYDLNLL